MTQQYSTQTKCTDCGKNTTVPFKPTPGKPVYCRDCFEKHRSNRTDTGKRTETRSLNPNGEKQAWARRRKNWIN